MVLPDGTLPMKTITDTFSERSFEECFGKSHHIFHWIYRTSRNWRSVVDLLPGMRRHLRSYTAIPSGGQAYDEYSTLFQEMFCVAAKELADATHQPLETVGVLYEDIMITGGVAAAPKSDPEAPPPSPGRRKHHPGRGKVLFLVKKVEKSEAARLCTFGFRFTAPPNVYDPLARSMLVSKQAISLAVSQMATYEPEREALLPPGVYLGCFAVQADVSGGFDVLVDRNTSSLPMEPLGVPALTSAHFRFLQQFNGKTAAEIGTDQRSDVLEAARSAGLTEEFAAQFNAALSRLRRGVGGSYFNSAVLDSDPQFLPTASPKDVGPGSVSGSVAQLIVFKTIVPIHTPIEAAGLAMTPFTFFSTQQRSYVGCPEHQVHARRTHREFSVRIAPVHGGGGGGGGGGASGGGGCGGGGGGKGDLLSGRGGISRLGGGVARLWNLRRIQLGSPTDLSSRSPSMSSEKNLVLGGGGGNGNDPFTSAGIMVSHSVSVDVVEPKSATEMKDLGPRVAVTKLDDSTENLTWCEALFKGMLQDVRR